MQDIRTKIGIPDIIVCLAAVITSVIILVFTVNSQSDTVYIKTSSQEYKYDLFTDRTEHITSNGYHLVVTIKDGKVQISESDCPDKVCVKTGKTDDSSKPVICAPAKVIIRVDKDGGVSDADFIAGR